MNELVLKLLNDGVNVTQTSTYKTSDGKVWDKQNEAVTHEWQIQVEKALVVVLSEACDKHDYVIAEDKIKFIAKTLIAQSGTITELSNKV